MRKSTIALLLTGILFIVGCTSTIGSWYSRSEALYLKKLTYKIVQLDASTIKIYYSDYKFYIVENYEDGVRDNDILPHKFCIPIEYTYGRRPISNKYFKLNGKNYTIGVSSTNKKVATVIYDNCIEITGDGERSIEIAIDGIQVSIPIKVVRIPIKERLILNKEDVIGVLGVPDETQERYIPWARSALVNGFFYKPHYSNTSGLTVRHWRYNDYPEMIVSFNNSGAFISPGWNQVELKYYSLKE